MDARGVTALLSRSGEDETVLKTVIPFLLAALLGVASSATETMGAAGNAVGRVAISRETCRWLIRHTARADVRYRPGVDVEGRPVAPADLPGRARIHLPKDIVIEIDVHLETLLGLTLAPGVDPDARLGYVVVRDGRVFFNGQPLFDAAQVKLAARCAAAIGK